MGGNKLLSSFSLFSIYFIIFLLLFLLCFGIVLSLVFICLAAGNICFFTPFSSHYDIVTRCIDIYFMIFVFLWNWCNSVRRHWLELFNIWCFFECDLWLLQRKKTENIFHFCCWWKQKISASITLEKDMLAWALKLTWI